MRKSYGEFELCFTSDTEDTAAAVDEEATDVEHIPDVEEEEEVPKEDEFPASVDELQEEVDPVPPPSAYSEADMAERDSEPVVEEDPAADTDVIIGGSLLPVVAALPKPLLNPPITFFCSRSKLVFVADAAIPLVDVGIAPPPAAELLVVAEAPPEVLAKVDPAVDDEHSRAEDVEVEPALLVEEAFVVPEPLPLVPLPLLPPTPPPPLLPTELIAVVLMPPASELAVPPAAGGAAAVTVELPPFEDSAAPTLGAGMFCPGGSQSAV